MNGARVTADVLQAEHPELGLLIQSIGKNEEIDLTIRTNGATTVRIASAWSTIAAPVQLELLPVSA